MFFSVDVEATGQCPGIYEMFEIGVVAIKRNYEFATFHRKLKITGERYELEAIKACGFQSINMLINRVGAIEPSIAMQELSNWIKEVAPDERAVMFSDNPAFDFQFVNYYSHLHIGRNPFGFSARRIGDIYAGLTNRLSNGTKWKYMRDTPHDHNPLNDAMGNAEAFIKMCKLHGMRIYPVQKFESDVKSKS